MTKQSINVNINLDGLRSELRRALQRIIYLVSAGLQTTENIEAEKLQLPTNGIKMTYAKNMKYTSEEIREHYRAWLMTNGFRDSIECVSAFLESAHQVLSFWQLAGHQKKKEVKISDLNEIVVSATKKFHRLGFPNKIDHIKKDHGIDLQDHFIVQLISINAARNCFVHRHGIVADLDVTVDNKLEVNWTRLQLVLTNEDGEREAVFGEVMEKDSILGIRSVGETKSFEKGTAVEFSVKEFSDITWTFFLFSEDLVTKLQTYGLQQGFVTPAVEKENDEKLKNTQQNAQPDSQ